MIPTIAFPVRVLLIILALSAAMLQARPFKDKQGRTIEAEIVSRLLDSVTIKMANGKEFTLPLSTFSQEDQDFIKAWKAPAPAPGTVAPVSIQPGATIALSFPNLPTDLNGQPAVCNLRIPDDYKPDQPVPLLVWLSSGKGGNQPTGGYVMVDQAKFAIAALPYPSTAPAPKAALTSGKTDAIYSYHQTMLAEIQRLLPNLHAKVRIIAGVSDGSHLIGHAIATNQKEYTDFFNAFVIVEGGTTETKSRKPLRDKFAYLAWGDTERGSKDYMQSMVECIKDSRMETVTHEMPGVGNVFPDAEKLLVKKWIEETVIPGLAAQK